MSSKLTTICFQDEAEPSGPSTKLMKVSILESPTTDTTIKANTAKLQEDGNNNCMNSSGKFGKSIRKNEKLRGRHKRKIGIKSKVAGKLMDEGGSSNSDIEMDDNDIGAYGNRRDLRVR